MSFHKLTLFCLLFLTGCASQFSGKKTQIGGVGEGSCKSYYCRGKRHYPQKFYEYSETGLASWYGPGFHGKPKPYGEKFNKFGFSAAHRTLPLPTVVKVTNLSNGKSMKLVVDDRGPFTYKGRIIDLSMGAAKRLGIIGQGIAKVKVESIPHESILLSNYLAKHGNGRGRMRDGRTWQQVYYQEIAKQHMVVPQVPTPIKSSPKTSEIKRLKPKTTSNKPKNKHKHLQSKKTKTKPKDKAKTAVKKPAKKTITKNSKLNKAKAVSYNKYIKLNHPLKSKKQAEALKKAFPANWQGKVQQKAQEHHIILGPFNKKADAERILNLVKKRGFKQASVG